MQLARVVQITVALLSLLCIDRSMAQVAPQGDTPVRAYRLERELEDKKEEIRLKKVTAANYKSVSDIVSQAIAKASQNQYPPNLPSLFKEITDAAKFASKREDVRPIVAKLVNANRQYYQATTSIEQLIDTDDSTLSIEEKKMLRPLVATAISQTQASIRPKRRFTNVPIELFIDEDSIEIKKIFPGFPTSISASEVGIKELLTELSIERFNSQKDLIIQALSQIQKQVTQSISDNQKATDALNSDIEKLAERLEKTRERGSKVDEALIYFSMPGLAVLMIGLLVAPRIYKNDALHLEVFKSGLLLELFTVFFITATILILGLGGKIDSPILGTLLSGIAGYVLGRASGKNKQPGQGGG